MASFLLANVRSVLGRRRSSPNCVPSAFLSYAAQASNMQVCAIARARATIGGPMRESRTPCNAAASHRTTTLSLTLDWPITPGGQITTATASKHRKYIGSLNVGMDGRAILAAIGTLLGLLVDESDLVRTSCDRSRCGLAARPPASVAAIAGRCSASSRRRRLKKHQEKKTPLCSVPNWAKSVCEVAGSDSKWKPCPVSLGVVAETTIFAEHS